MGKMLYKLELRLRTHYVVTRNPVSHPVYKKSASNKIYGKTIFTKMYICLIFQLLINCSGRLKHFGYATVNRTNLQFYTHRAVSACPSISWLCFVHFMKVDFDTGKYYYSDSESISTLESKVCRLFRSKYKTKSIESSDEYFYGSKLLSEEKKKLGLHY